MISFKDSYLLQYDKEQIFLKVIDQEYWLYKTSLNNWYRVIWFILVMNVIVTGEIPINKYFHKYREEMQLLKTCLLFIQNMVVFYHQIKYDF